MRRRIRFQPGGGFAAVYADGLRPLVDRPGVEFSLRRASHVNPGPDNKFYGDLGPSGGPVLGPFETYAAAVAAEVEWLEKHLEKVRSQTGATMIKNCDINSHPDWYLDGAEWGSGHRCVEQLWRLDFAVGDNEYQAQLFAAVDPEQCVHDYTGCLRLPAEVATEDERYVSFRLFLERDNRADNGGPRIDYACDAWAITQERALELLALSEDALPQALASEVATVAALPSDAEMCD